MKVLVIEDEVDLAQAIVRAFRDQHYDVDTAYDGADGLFKSISGDFNVIVLDGMLPGLDGWEILQRLRQVRNTPVLMLTARDSTRDRVHGLDLGADDYLGKPFELAELLARVRALHRRGPDLSRSAVELGDITINLDARVVIREGQRVPLSKLEYVLLEYLALRRREVVARRILCEQVFSKTEDEAAGMLRAHIASLGRKLGAELIEEQPNGGYAMA